METNYSAGKEKVQCQCQKMNCEITRKPYVSVRSKGNNKRLRMK